MTIERKERINRRRKVVVEKLLCVSSKASSFRHSSIPYLPGTKTEELSIGLSPPSSLKVTRVHNRQHLNLGAQHPLELKMPETQEEVPPRELLISRGWDLHIVIRDAIVEFEEKTGLFIEEIRPIRKESADGAAEPTIVDIQIAVQLPHRT